MATHDGFIEFLASRVWKGALLASVAMVYLTASLCTGARPERKGNIQYFLEQNYSTKPLNILSPDLWIAGAQNLYVLSVCSLSLVLVLLGFIVLNKQTRSNNVYHRGDATPDP